ncbi:MAG: sigma-54-dependent Fis family transcriptional regulator [Deltaproteobacteria bacterium]|nr:sigma-54-dependent Fis family transcriptional regulator [Deltaproteobacteria bacterium]
MDSKSVGLLNEIRLEYVKHLSVKFLDLLAPTELPAFEAHFSEWLEGMGSPESGEDDGIPRYFRPRESGSFQSAELAAAYDAVPAVRGKLYQFIVSGMFLDYLKTLRNGDFETIKKEFSEKLDQLVKAYYLPTSEIRKEDLNLLQDELTRITLNYYHISGHIMSGDVRIASDLSGKEDLALIWGNLDDLDRKLDELERLARSEIPILVTGETGTGKTFLARHIHQLSRRSRYRCLIVNCASIPSLLFQSELFGYRKGAFTGAVQDKMGLFKAADRGTIFLDEIGELAPEDQVKLLQVLETQSFFPLGSLQEVSIDVRFMSGTNRPLEKAVQEGCFRQDLYYRIKGAEIGLPPLRDRIEVLPRLAQRIMERISEREGVKPAGISSATMELLKRYAWPGNVRELENVLQRAMALSRPGDIEPRHLPDEIAGLGPKTRKPSDAGGYLLRARLRSQGVEDRFLEEFLVLSRGTSFSTADLASKHPLPAGRGNVADESRMRMARRMLEPIKDEIIEDNGSRARAVRYRVRSSLLDQPFRGAADEINRAADEFHLTRRKAFQLYDVLMECREAGLTAETLADLARISIRQAHALLYRLQHRGVAPQLYKKPADRVQ